MKLLHAALAVVGGAHAERPGREQLKAALASLDSAQQAVSEARERCARLQAIINASDDAARTAANATREANASRERWVRDGCISNAREHRALADAAAEATRTAERAALDAKAVSQELARAQSALESRELEIRGSDATVSAEIGAIIAMEEAASLLQRYEESTNESRALRFQIKALQRVVDPDQYEDATAKSPVGARLVDDVLTRCRLLPWSQERDNARGTDFVSGHVGRDEAALEELASRWRARAAALLEDPDAE
jgi:hypothetical protein